VLVAPMLDIRKILWKTHAGWKYLKSFSIDSWTLDDYPIQYRHQEEGPTHQSRRNPAGWTASIRMWPGPAGFGATKSEALGELRKRFDEFKSKNPPPRPGTKVPVVFSEQKRIESHPALAEDFILRVLDLNWAFISDESSLWDFHTDDSNAKFIDKIRAIYGVDVSDISDGNLADILDRIAHSTDCGS
jgi:hypothetical protein